MLVLAADGPQERRPHGVLAAAFVAAVQHRVVDLHVRVLNLVRHHVEDMLKFGRLLDQTAAVIQPRRDLCVTD